MPSARLSILWAFRLRNHLLDKLRLAEGVRVPLLKRSQLSSLLRVPIHDRIDVEVHLAQDLALRFDNFVVDDSPGGIERRAKEPNESLLLRRVGEGLLVEFTDAAAEIRQETPLLRLAVNGGVRQHPVALVREEARSEPAQQRAEALF